VDKAAARAPKWLNDVRAAARVLSLDDRTLTGTISYTERLRIRDGLRECLDAPQPDADAVAALVEAVPTLLAYCSNCNGYGELLHGHVCPQCGPVRAALAPFAARRWAADAPEDARG
jgi:hypothetical protein